MAHYKSRGNRFSAILGALGLFVAAGGTAHAAVEGWYISVAGGGNHIQDDKVEGVGFSQEIEYDLGYAAQGAVGYQYPNGLRTELEAAYRTNDVDTIAAGRATGDVNVYSAMVNVLYDFDISDTGLDTYVGAGAGLAYVDYDSVSPAGGSIVDDSDVTPALQAMAGVSYDVGDATEIYMNYNYFYANNVNVKNAAAVDTETDYTTNTVMLGLKFALFDSPEPVPVADKEDKKELIPEPVAQQKPKQQEVKKVQAPPPPAPVSRTYIVFFDLNKATISNEAMKILSQAAQDAINGNAVSIQVVGHADTSGTYEHNMRLSDRRARNVEAALASMGINLKAIHTSAKGETDLLVPTADGVREPQNRRVEVTYVINPRRR